MVLEIIILSWFWILFFISFGKWVGDGDSDPMVGTSVVLGIPVIAAFISLICGG